ncbi:metallophosphatase family protein [Skermanella mucosa]|uniref:metallophosphoesterase family protein n=1 Tax=Skermanella mucosa TaxID=1789672 RepID=UPI00192A8D5F|nr:metallophosphoesterase family protein [Skermanella mucosa]UEM23844.1 metallophosphatase family protein [Skermanella mucosa]
MIAVISDIHANLEALEATLAAIRTERVARILCLGDIVGYNADPAGCIDLLREAGAVCVAGNHDRAVTGQITTEGFNPLAARAVEWTRMRLGPGDLDWLRDLPLKLDLAEEGGPGLVAVHGALHPDTGCELVRLDTDERRALSFAALEAHPSGARICAFGHTHRIGIFEKRENAVTAHQGDGAVIRDGSFFLVNPGTVGQPRSSDRRASFMLVDPATRTLQVRRVSYDYRRAMAKTRKAGLAARLSRVPEPLRGPIRRIYHAIRGRT